MRTLSRFGIVLVTLMGICVFTMVVPVPLLLGILPVEHAIASAVGCWQLWTHRHDVDFLSFVSLITLSLVTFGPWVLHMPMSTMMLAYSAMSVTAVLLAVELAARAE